MVCGPLACPSSSHRFIIGYIQQEFRLTFLCLSAGGGLSAVVRRSTHHHHHATPRCRVVPVPTLPAPARPAPALPAARGRRCACQTGRGGTYTRLSGCRRRRESTRVDTVPQTAVARRAATVHSRGPPARDAGRPWQVAPQPPPGRTQAPDEEDEQELKKAKKEAKKKEKAEKAAREKGEGEGGSEKTKTKEKKKDK